MKFGVDFRVDFGVKFEIIFFMKVGLEKSE